MKQLFILLAISVFFSQISYCQDSVRTRYIYTPREIKDYDYYHHKSKALIPAGYVFLGLGLGATIIGEGGLNKHYDIFTGAGVGYMISFAVGIGFMAAGIPDLITGYHYKHRAKLLMHQEHASTYYHMPIRANIYSVGIGLTIR